MCWMLLWKYILKHLAADIDLVLNDINYPRASTGYLAMQCLLKWPVSSEVTILSWEIAHAFCTPKSHEWSHIKSHVEENNMQSKVLPLEQRGRCVGLNFAGASGRILETKALVTVGSLDVFCTNQERKTQVCNQIMATKKGKLQSNFGDVVLVLEVAMETWRLSSSTFVFTKWLQLTLMAGPIQHRRRDLFITEPTGKDWDTQSQAKRTGLGRLELVWPSKHTELKDKHETKSYATLRDISHSAEVCQNLG